MHHTTPDFLNWLNSYKFDKKIKDDFKFLNSSYQNLIKSFITFYYWFISKVFFEEKKKSFTLRKIFQEINVQNLGLSFQVHPTIHLEDRDRNAAFSEYNLSTILQQFQGIISDWTLHNLNG